jgi:UDP-3-O-[3-hydroxymyristoyl] glucosamine N-acyltransferase
LAARRFTLGTLAAALGAALEGDPDRVITGVAPLESAEPDHISFLTDPRYRDRLRTSRAGAFLVALDAVDVPAPRLRTAAPHQALIDLLLLFHPPVRPTPGIHPTAVVAAEACVDATAAIGALTVVGERARIAAGVRLHPLVYVGAEAEIGEGSELYPHVVVRERVSLGRRVIVHAGAVIGSDGFGYVPGPDGHRKIPQVGTVVIEDDVEIGANSAIDRATVGATIVRRGTKIDNLVQVGHNVEIGERSMLVAQVGVSGSTRLGRAVVLGGQVGIADHVTVGDGAMIAAQSGIHADVPAGERLLGTPARRITQAKRIMLTETHLPEFARRLRELERRLERLEAGPRAPEVGPDARTGRDG